MSNTTEHINELSEVMERLQHQRKDAANEVIELSNQISTGLLAGEDVTDLLTARWQKQILLEAINPVLIGATRQMDELKLSMDHRPLSELEKERAILWKRYEKLNTKTLLGNVHPHDTKGQRELEAALIEKERLYSTIQQLDWQIREVQTQSFIPVNGASQEKSVKKFVIPL
jgi:hypothetical protein